MSAVATTRLLACVAASAVLVALIACATQPACAISAAHASPAATPIAALTRWHAGDRDLLLVDDRTAGTLAIYDARNGAPLNRPTDAVLASAAP